MGLGYRYIIAKAKAPLGMVEMGADIAIEGSSAIVRGGRPLSGAPVMASDLRASAGLVMAGLAATDPKLVPYGAMTATFFTGLGCLLGPSLVFMINRALF